MSRYLHCLQTLFGCRALSVDLGPSRDSENTKYCFRSTFATFLPNISTVLFSQSHDNRPIESRPVFNHEMIKQRAKLFLKYLETITVKYQSRNSMPLASKCFLHELAINLKINDILKRSSLETSQHVYKQ